MMTSQSPKVDVGAAMVAMAWSLFAIATILVALRTYSRLRLTKQQDWGWDDTFAIIALIFVCIGAILTTLLAKDGMGKHTADLADRGKSYGSMAKYSDFMQIETALCTFFTKVSISIYLLRIKNDRGLRIFLQVIVLFMFLATLAMVIVSSISCIPLEKLWTPGVKGNCMPEFAAHSVAYVQSGFAICTDLILTLSPLIILWRVRMNKWKKLRVCILMSLGLIATVMNALRNYFQTRMSVEEFMYRVAPIVLTVVLEQSLGLIAACVPACMPFFHFQKDKLSRHVLPRQLQTMDQCKQSVDDAVDSHKSLNFEIVEEEMA